MRFQKISRGIVFSILFTLLLVTGACSLPQQMPSGHSHGHESVADTQGHGHDHGEENESVSLWTDDVELFAEFPLLVAGEPQEFLLHLTHIHTGLPVQDVPISYEATRTSAGEAIAGQAHARRTGIYVIQPVFPSGDEWILTLHVPVDDRTVPVVMDDLDVHGEDEMHDHDHHSDELLPNIIRFTKEQQWVVPLITVPAEIGAVVERRSLPAMVLATPETRNVATAPVAGVAHVHEGIPFPTVGGAVVKGEILALLAPDAVSAESLARDANVQGMVNLRTELNMRAVEAAGNAARARALAAQHDTALKRAEALLAAGAGAQRDVDALRGTLEEARAVLVAAERAEDQARQALEETQALSGVGAAGVIEIAAPISGNITRIFAGPGTRVTGGDPLFEIVNTAQVIIEARAPESLATIVEGTPSGMFEIPGRSGELHEIIRPEGAPQPWILPYVDEGTRTVPVLFHAANPDGLLRVGLSPTIWLDVRRVEDAIRIPRSAVVDENGIPTVYVMLEGETFQKRNVRLGISDGTHVEVLDGVGAGERVASQGAYAVRLAGLADANLGSAHVH